MRDLLRSLVASSTSQPGSQRMRVLVRRPESRTESRSEWFGRSAIVLFIGIHTRSGHGGSGDRGAAELIAHYGIAWVKGEL